MKNILIADDESSFLLSVTEGLKAYQGIRVVTAENGKTAAEYISAFPFDLVITDLQMPVMDGFELLKFIREERPGVPVIVMTAFSSPEAEEKLRALGVLWYLEKPLDLERLSAAISLCLGDGKESMHGRGITPLTFFREEDSLKETGFVNKEKARDMYGS